MFRDCISKLITKLVNTSILISADKTSNITVAVLGIIVPSSRRKGRTGGNLFVTNKGGICDINPKKPMIRRSTKGRIKWKKTTLSNVNVGSTKNSINYRSLLITVIGGRRSRRMMRTNSFKETVVGKTVTKFAVSNIRISINTKNKMIT